MERDIGLIPLFIEESSFLLTPSVRRTWAPQGRTPVLHHWQRHDRVSVISALTVSPRPYHCGRYVRCQADQNLYAADVCAFLRALRAHLLPPGYYKCSSWPSWPSP